MGEPRLIVADTLLAKSNRIKCRECDETIAKNHVSFLLKPAQGKKGKAQYSCLGCVKTFYPLGPATVEAPERLDEDQALKEAERAIDSLRDAVSEEAFALVVEALVKGEAAEMAGKGSDSPESEAALAAATTANDKITEEVAAAAKEKRAEAARKRKAAGAKKVAKRRKKDDSDDEDSVVSDESEPEAGDEDDDDDE